MHGGVQPLHGGGCSRWRWGLRILPRERRPAQAGRSPTNARCSMRAAATDSARFPLPTSKDRRAGGGHFSGSGSISGGSLRRRQQRVEIARLPLRSLLVAAWRSPPARAARAAGAPCARCALLRLIRSAIRPRLGQLVTIPIGAARQHRVDRQRRGPEGVAPHDRGQTRRRCGRRSRTCAGCAGRGSGTAVHH